MRIYMAFMYRLEIYSLWPRDDQTWPISFYKGYYKGHY